MRDEVAAHPSGTAVRIVRGQIAHPRDAGARPTSTWPAGQIADYAIDFAAEEPLTVREYSAHWEAFFASAALSTQVLRAIDHDPSKAMYVGAALLGGAIGTSVSNKREGMLLGAGLGLLFASVLDSSLKNNRSARG